MRRTIARKAWLSHGAVFALPAGHCPLCRPCGGWRIRCAGTALCCAGAGANHAQSRRGGIPIGPQWDSHGRAVPQAES